MAALEPRIVEKGLASDSVVIATVVGNRLGVPVKEYLADVLPGLDRRPMSQVADLTPARLAAAHRQSPLDSSDADGEDKALLSGSQSGAHPLPRC
jgi:hypothetical protein